MLNKVKLALRINNSAYDLEIESLISTCKAELELVGIASSNIIESDPMIEQTIIMYCKANFGLGNNDAERYNAAYNNLKSFLCLSGNYKEGE